MKSNWCQLLKRNRYLLRWFAPYGITFLIVLPLLCHNMENSVYFLKKSKQKERIATAKVLDQQRTQEARELMESWSIMSHHQQKGESIEKKPLVVISIITQSRRDTRLVGYRTYFLTQTVMRMLTLIQKVENDFPVKVFVCNVDFDPENYKEALELKGIIDVVNSVNKLTLTSLNAKEKERKDYMFCLNRSLDYNSEYVFLVEDDALPMEDALRVLKHVLVSHISSEFSSDRVSLSAQGIAYIKFYHPEHLLQFTSAGVERIPELVSLAIVLSTLVTGFSVLVWTSLHTSTLNVYCIWSYWFVFFILVSLSVGRTNLLRLHRFLSPHLYSLTPAPSCCTQAVLYPRHSAKYLLQYMSTKTCNNTYAKDHILDEFPVQSHTKAYLVQPNVFEHIGFYSAVRRQLVDPLYL